MVALEARTHPAIAISVSESPDLAALGLSDRHLRDAMARLALQLLAARARLAYGGDLRLGGFTELLRELVARYWRTPANGLRLRCVTDYLAWPVHASMERTELRDTARQFAGIVDLVCLGRDGGHLDFNAIAADKPVQPTEDDWTTGLTSMRRVMCEKTDGRVQLGGRVQGFKGSMPGIAEEALLALEARQPLFLIGGFGGCTRDIAESLGLVEPLTTSPREWPGRSMFDRFDRTDLRNGLSEDENAALAATPAIDQSIVLILRGLHRMRNEPALKAAQGLPDDPPLH